MTTNAAPVRVQRSRALGWRMPENTVYVGRGSSWGNPFVVVDGVAGSREYALHRYREGIDGQIPPLHGIKKNLWQLKGKNLACWCRLDQKCHADILIALANPQDQRTEVQ